VGSRWAVRRAAGGQRVDSNREEGGTEERGRC
jgi:hypothetical protein